jgi:tetratricopeptide (TPR) repeat protein
MWRRISILLLSGALSSVTAVAGDQLTDLLDKGRQAARNGNYDEAERYQRLAVEAATSEPDPALRAEAIGDLGGVLLAKGRFDEARALCLNALSLLQNTKTKKYLPVVLNNLGALSNYVGDYEQAERYLKEAVRVSKEFNPGDPYVARVLNNLGVLYYSTGDDGHAEKALKTAISIIESNFGKDRVELVPLLANLGEVYLARKKWSASKAQFDKAFTILEASGRSGHIDAAAVLGGLGRLEFARGNLAEAREAFRRSYTIRVGVFGPDHPAVASTAVNLAAALTATGEYVDAERLYTDALKIHEKASGSRSLQVAATLEKLTELYRKTHREEDADVTEARAKNIRFEIENVIPARSFQ